MPTDGGPAPRLSVIVAAWNAAGTLSTAIGSVLEQTDADLECVVVDDGSTDGTAEVLARLADPRLVVEHLPENRGVSAARNRALELARGEWVAFLDADDRLLPGGLAALLRAGDATDALAVVGQRISNDGERTWYPKLYDLPDIREPGRKSLVSHPDLLYYVGPVGKLFRRSTWEGLRFEGRMVGDQPWVVQALVRAGDRIEVVEDVVYEWRRPRPGNEFQTITAARERSATLGAEAVAAAGVAWHAASRAFRAAWDAETATRMEALYLRRILRADLAAQLHRATERRDPDLALLIGALERLLRDVAPAAVRGAEDAIRIEVLDPLFRARFELAPASRRAAFDISATAVHIDRGILRSTPGRARRWPIRLAATVPVVGRPVGRLLAEAWLRIERRRATPAAPAAPGT
jgi:hypothetical protein